MKKFIFSVIGTSFLFINAFANENEQTLQTDLLSGDTKLSCEAILCLSSSTRPSQCSESLSYYFGLKAKKWSDTVTKRRNFLKLCPVGGADIEDLVFADLRDNVLPNSDPRECTAEYLNKQVETNYQDYYNSYNSYTNYRINPNIPKQCEALYSHSYTAIERPNYICSGEFYSKLEWNLSAKLQAISYKEYRSLDNNSKYSISDGEGYSYYRKIPFSKTCWIEKE